jgi:4-amino-4-deoxy-L-arabinose transferase-like glycosyltransferase
MVKTRPGSFLTVLLGILVLAVGVGARSFYLSRYGFTDSGPNQVWQVQGRGLLSTDGSALDQLVANLKQRGIQQGFVAKAPLGPDKEEPSAFVAPLHPLYRAGLELLAEQYGETLALNKASLVRWVQVILGGLTCLLYYLIAWRAFGQHQLLALVVGLSVALYPYWIINVGELEDGVLASFLLAWALCLGVGIGQQGGAMRSLLLGVVLAALALTRASLLPFAIVVLLWLFLRCRQLKNGGACAVLSFLGFVAGLAPWGYHTFTMLKSPVPIVTSTWFDVWVGNNPESNGGDYLWNMKKHVKDAKQLEDAPQADRYGLLADEVLTEVTHHPVATAKRRLKAATQFFAGTTFSQEQLFVPGDKTPPPSWWLSPALIGSLALLLILATLGWRWSYGWKTHSAPLSLAIFWIPLPYLLTHAGPLHSSRLPLDGVFIVLGCLGLLALLPVIGTRLLRGEHEAEA